MGTKFVTYIRVSTKQQGNSGLGIEAQRNICQQYIQSHKGELDQEFIDIESGKSRTRKGLWDAIEYCKKTGIQLVIAKLDRLARDVEFTFKVINTNIDIHFCDMPMVNTMILGVFAAVAQYERELISSRTKAALQAKKARGEKWVHGTITDKTLSASAKARKEKATNDPANIFFEQYCKMLRERGYVIAKPYTKDKLETMAYELNKLGQKTPTGAEYNAARVRAMLTKLDRWNNQQQ